MYAGENKGQRKKEKKRLIDILNDMSVKEFDTLQILETLQHKLPESANLIGNLDTENIG